METVGERDDGKINLAFELVNHLFIVGIWFCSRELTYMVQVCFGEIAGGNDGSIVNRFKRMDMPRAYFSAADKCGLNHNKQPLWK